VSLRQTFIVHLDDGSEHTVEADGRDFRAWEAWKGESVIGSSASLTRMAEWAYLAGRRQGLWNGTYEEWEPSAVDVDLKGAAVANPTNAAPSESNSSPLPSEQASAPRTGKSPAKKRS